QSGQLNVKIKVSAQDKGNKLAPDITVKLSDFSGKFGSNRIDRAGADITLRATMENSDKINISDLHVSLTQADQAAANISASGSYGMKSQEADLKATVEAAL